MRVISVQGELKLLLAPAAQPDTIVLAELTQLAETHANQDINAQRTHTSKNSVPQAPINLCLPKIIVLIVQNDSIARTLLQQKR